MPVYREAKEGGGVKMSVNGFSFLIKKGSPFSNVSKEVLFIGS